MTQRKDQLLQLLEEQARAKREARLLSWVPYDKQKDFIAATADHTEVVLQAGNQGGKSTVGAVSMAVHATGLYPQWWEGRRFDHPIRAWCVGESSVAVRDISQRLLCGAPGDESAWGTGFIPKNLLTGKILSHGAGGALDVVKVKHASGGTSEITFKSYEMSREKFQGSSLDVIWADEEPPLDLYLEMVARLIATNGLIYSTFTPLSGLTQVLPRFAERTPEAMKARIVIRMRLADVPHLQDPERQKALIATFPAHQKGARLQGDPMLGSGAVWEDVNIDDLLVPLRIHKGQVVHDQIGVLDTRAWSFLWGIDFGIAHPFAAVLAGWDRDNDRVFVLAELKISGGVPAIHASRMKAIAANVKVAYPHDGAAREKGSGETLASLYKAEGLDMLPSHATFAGGGYSTETGVMDILARMKSDRFSVAQGCFEWQSEAANYHRDQGLIVKTGDDLMSATRIAVMALRNARPAKLGSERIVNRSREPQIASGMDFDPFTGR